MHTVTVIHKRERRKYTERLEIKGECPLCSHTCTVVFTGSEKEYYCPDKFCPNCKDRHEE